MTRWRATSTLNVASSRGLAVLPMNVVDDVVGQTLHRSLPAERAVGTAEIAVMLKARTRASTIGVAAIGPRVRGLLKHGAEVALDLAVPARGVRRGGDVLDPLAL